MNFRSHKKKLTALGLLLILAGLFVAAPLALKPGAELAIRAKGFPKAEVGAVRFLPHGIYIDKILLDPNGFTEIDDVEIQGKWRDLILNRQAEKILIKTISISGEIDKKNRITIAGWDGTFGAPSGEKAPLPFQSFYLENLTADLATPIGALRIQGKINLDADNSGGKILNAALFSSQQQLTTSLNIKGRLDSQNNISGKIDIEDTSLDIPPASATRLSGWIEFKFFPDFTAVGQIMAGGLKYNNFPFEDANLTFDTSQTTVGIFKTKMTGQDVFLNAEWIKKPDNIISLIASAPNLGALAALADMENKLLSASGPVEIKANVKMTDQLAPKNEISVADIKTALAGGIFEVKPFTWYGDGRRNSLVLQLNKMKLSELIGKDSPSLQANGSMSGVIPLSYLNNEITIENGVLRSDQAASFKYVPEVMPAALQGDDTRMATVRQALSDYQYDTLEITLSGPLNGNLKTALKAKGKSPAFENRPVNLNLNLEGALTSALTQALQPGTLSDKLKEQLTKDQK